MTGASHTIFARSDTERQNAPWPTGVQHDTHGELHEDGHPECRQKVVPCGLDFQVKESGFSEGLALVSRGLTYDSYGSPLHEFL